MLTLWITATETTSPPDLFHLGGVSLMLGVHLGFSETLTIPFSGCYTLTCTRPVISHSRTLSLIYIFRHIRINSVTQRPRAPSLSQVKSRLFKKEKGGDTYSATKQDCVCVCVCTFSTKPLVPGAFVYLCTCWTRQAFTATHTHTVSQEYKVTAKVSHNRRRHIQYTPAQTHSIGSLLVWRDPKINDIDIFSLICLILVLVKYWKSKHVLMLQSELIFIVWPRPQYFPNHKQVLWVRKHNKGNLKICSLWERKPTGKQMIYVVSHHFKDTLTVCEIAATVCSLKNGS